MYTNFMIFFANLKNDGNIIENNNLAMTSF